MTTEPTGPSYRDRLMAGMAASLTQRTYRDTTIGEIVAYARTSRRTFYKEFSGLDDCYFALLRSVHSEILGMVATAVDMTADWRVQVRQAITAYFAGVQTHPAVIRSYVRELPSLGDPTVTLQSRPRDQFIALLVGLSDTASLRSPDIAPVTVEMARFLVGGLEELTALVVEENRAVEDVVETAITATTRLLGPATG